MSDYGEDYLRRLLDAVRRFDAAFNAWMETQQESDHLSSRGLLPTVWVKDGVDPALVRRLELDVAEAAGLAARAVAVTGATFPSLDWVLLTRSPTGRSCHHPKLHLHREISE